MAQRAQGGCRLGSTHRDEREGAGRVDGDAKRLIEPGAAAGAVEEASRAAAGEGGGRPGGDVDTADTVVVTVLRCIMGEDTLRKSQTEGLAAQLMWCGNRCGPYAVCARRVCCLRDGGMRDA